MNEQNKHYMHEAINDYYQLVKKEIPMVDDPKRINDFFLQLCDAFVRLTGDRIAFPDYDQISKELNGWYKKYKLEVNDND